jgi:hypothetical protein
VSDHHLTDDLDGSGSSEMPGRAKSNGLTILSGVSQNTKSSTVFGEFSDERVRSIVLDLFTSRPQKLVLLQCISERLEKKVELGA